MKIGRHRPRRSGNILVLTAFLITVSFVILAFAVDLGYYQVVSGQLQRSADAAAITSAWDLLHNSPLVGGDAALASSKARASATQYVTLNTEVGKAPDLAAGDVTIGYLQNPSDTSQPILTAASNPPGNPARFNVVQVTIRRTADQNGEVPFSFSRVIGFNSLPSTARATAAFINNFSGFKTPSSGGNLMIFPFALDKETWDGLLAGTGTDGWSYDPVTKKPVSGADGVLEVNLFPQGTGAPGNRGTLRIGRNNNGTRFLGEQILNGLTADDLAPYGGALKLNAAGELILPGDTGISAGMKAELGQILGETRIVPIFNSVAGQGAGAQYTIVAFAGIRVMECNLTGSMSSKRVMIQPAVFSANGGIPGGSTQTSYYMFSPVWLVR
jgi:Flp pilus assembly protein TadG